MSEPLIITASDLTPRHCAWGLRYWFRLHGMDFADFLKNGISVERMLATGDRLAVEAVERKRASLEVSGG